MSVHGRTGQVVARPGFQRFSTRGKAVTGVPLLGTARRGESRQGIHMAINYTLKKAIEDYRQLTENTSNLDPEIAASFATSALALIRDGLRHAPRLHGLFTAVAALAPATSEELSGTYTASSTRTGLLELTRAGLITRGRHPRLDGQIGASPWVYSLTALGERVAGGER
jgi:hypothetical protein